jgi:hypothetical protein
VEPRNRAQTLSAVRVRGAKVNDEIGIAWIDNHGETNSVKTNVPPSS